MGLMNQMEWIDHAWSFVARGPDGDHKGAHHMIPWHGGRIEWFDHPEQYVGGKNTKYGTLSSCIQIRSVLLFASGPLIRGGAGVSRICTGRAVGGDGRAPGPYWVRPVAIMRTCTKQAPVLGV